MAAGGGAWKVAYADFVTAMMAFFLVMWITSQSDDTKKAIGGYFNDPWGTAAENRASDPKAATGLKGDAPFADSATGIVFRKHDLKRQGSLRFERRPSICRKCDRHPAATLAASERRQCHR
jgi:hypothetical protein